MEKKLKDVFRQRLQQAMGQRSANELAKLAKQQGIRLGQTTISLALRNGNPRLETIEDLARVLGVPAWVLIADEAQVETVVYRPATVHQKIIPMPSPYPKIFQDSTTKSHSARKKRVR